MTFFLTQFSQFSENQKLTLFRLLATTLSPLRLTFFNSNYCLTNYRQKKSRNLLRGQKNDTKQSEQYQNWIP
jgi:Trm5-related predicted tRNA methylase